MALNLLVFAAVDWQMGPEIMNRYFLNLFESICLSAANRPCGNELAGSMGNRLVDLIPRNGFRDSGPRKNKFRSVRCRYTNMNAHAAGNALNNLSLPVIKKRSTARNAAKPRSASSSVVPACQATPLQVNAVRVYHRAFPEPDNNVAAVGCIKILDPSEVELWKTPLSS